MGTVQDVFVVEDPGTVARATAESAASDAHRDAMVDAAAAIHPDLLPHGIVHGRITGVRGRGVRMGGQVEPVPEGWRWSTTRDEYRPAQGRAGDTARGLLAAWSRWPVEPVAAVCASTGLPYEARVAGDGGSIRLYWASLCLDGDRAWVLYGTRLDAVDPDVGSVAERRGHVGDTTPLRGARRATLGEWRAALERMTAEGADMVGAG